MSQTLTAARPVLSGSISGRRAVAATDHSRGHPRLTLRGRLVVLAVLVIVGFALFSLAQLASHAVAADPTVPGSFVPTTEWVVQPGETLWQIAEAIAPLGDPRDTVARIVQLNDLPTSSVLAGQTLLIPA